MCAYDTRRLDKALLLLATSCAVAGTTGMARAEKAPALAQVEFGNDFFRRDGATAPDLSRFAEGNPVPAGSYRVDLYLNGSWLGRHEVLFRSQEGARSATPCFNRNLLDAMGVDPDKLSESSRAMVAGAEAGACLRLDALMADATSGFDMGELRLDVSVPQAFVRRTARGYVNPQSWDHGVNAGFLSYMYNGYNSSAVGGSNTSHYLNLNSGINLGDWRLRNNSTYARQANGRSSVQTLASYAQRSIVSWNSQLTVGDTFTSGQLFDSLAFRGVRLASDPRMLPDSQSGYAPVVRGTARSNAKVQVFQGANLIYETTVAPGPFEINDLYPTGFGGNLRVLVSEADGSRSSFDVPYGSVAQLLRPGTNRYELTAGRLRSNFPGAPSLNFTQATYEYGWDNNLTLFGGLTAAPDYLALLGGTAFNTPVGAMSLGLTQSHAQVASGQTRQGQSLKLDYNKLLVASQTNIALAAYRYSSSGYLRLQDLQMLRALQARGLANQIDRPRSQLQLSISQALGEGNGSFYLVGSSANYWNRGGYGTTYTVGYNNHWKSISYGVSVQRQRIIPTGQVNTQVQFQMSMPLGRELRAPILSSQVSRDTRSGTSLQTTLSGVAGDNNSMSYGATVSRSPGSTMTSLNGDYRAPYAVLGAGYSYANGGQRQMSLRAAGALVAYSGGILPAQSLGDTIAIIHAEGAAGAQVNSAGVYLDQGGRAVVPFLSPFRNNEVVLDPKGTSTDVELSTTSQRVAPYAGAVVLMKYATVSGRSLLIKAFRAGNESIPFGAEVLDEQGAVLGMAGQGGVIFLRTSSDHGRLRVRWGAQRNEQCVLQYALGPRENGAAAPLGFEQVSTRCETPAEMARKKGAGAEVVGQLLQAVPAMPATAADGS